MAEYPIIDKLVEKLLALKSKYPSVDDANILKMMDLEIKLKSFSKNL